MKTLLKQTPISFTREQAEQVANAMQGDDYEDFVFKAIPAPVGNQFWVQVTEADTGIFVSLVCTPTH
tara:strand:- start:365 stop:565 length:201 start_codon:yes stop_codon:yes gene_type:complete